MRFSSLLRLDALSRGYTVLLSGSVARLALGFVASVLIARALGPVQFGVYAVLAAVAAIAGAVADFGLSGAGVKRVAEVWERDPAAAEARARTFFWLRVGVALLTVLIGWLLSGVLARQVLDLPDGGPLVALALLGVLATALSGAVSTLLQATGRFARLSGVLMLNSGLTAVLAVALWLLGWLNLVTALLILGVVTSLVSFGVGLRWLPFPLLSATRGHTRGAHVGLSALAARFGPASERAELLRFSRWLGVASCCAMLAAYLDVLLMNRLLAPAVVGVYALALNLANKADVVNHSLYTVLLPAASALEGRAAIGRYIRQGMLRSGAICLVLLPAFPLAGPFITLFYGADFAPAVGLFQLLLLVVLFDVFTTPLLLLAYTYNQPKLLAGSDALRAVVLLLLALLLLPLYGPLGAVIARFAARIAGMAVIITFVVRKQGT